MRPDIETNSCTGCPAIGGIHLKYQYRVRDNLGTTHKGILEAENRYWVINSLLEQGYYILQLKEVQQSSPSIELDLNALMKVKVRELCVMTRQLATMLTAGLPIIRTFNILAEQTSDKKIKKAVTNIRNDLEAGLPLWESLGKHPDVFSTVYVSMIRAGEIGGILEPILHRLSDHLEREQEISAKVKAASIYPIIISVFALIMVFVILTFVMPTFVSMFASSGVELPAPTRVLLSLATILRSKGVFMLAGLTAVIILLKAWGKKANGRLFFDRLYLKLPVIGPTISRIAVARFARTMGTLVKSGIPVLQALEIVEDVVGNAVISRAVKSARISIREGESIALPLVQSGVFEPMVTQMIAVGEETGALDEMLIKMSDYFEREVIYMIDSMMSVIEPLLILVVALLVGGIVVATLMPIFEIVNTVG